MAHKLPLLYSFMIIGQKGRFIQYGQSKSFGESCLVFCDGMHSKFDWPFVYPLLAQMPIIPQTVGYHVSLGTHFCSTDRDPSIIKRFDLILCLIVPEVQSSVSSSSHEPSVVDGVEGDTVDGVEDGVSSLFLLVTLERDDRFLNKRGFTGENRPLTFLVSWEIFALPSNEATPKLLHLWLMATDWICEYFPKSLD